MDNDERYKVTGYKETAMLVPLPGGTFQRVKKVTFYIGGNGPYERAYGTNDGTPETIAADINAQIAALRKIHANVGY